MTVKIASTASRFCAGLGFRANKAVATILRIVNEGAHLNNSINSGTQ
jgi:hypothetical protein